MTFLELLSPARDLECGKAAIDHGADAVYIGARRFGARASVGNSIEDIEQLCTYAHRYAAKVYVTVNTIVYDGELDDTRELLEQLVALGVDAVIVQDMAVASMVEGMGLHASTQTDNRTVEKVRWLRDAGFSRTVLARELSAEEIAKIHSQVPDMPLEVFVHGALCVSYSGLCYASQHCFKRSANRGECAQFCRLAFDLVDSDNKLIERNRYLLSLKDMNQSANLAKLIEAGATSFKIEGRLKDATYVKNVTAAYSQLLDAYIAKHPDKYRRASLGRCNYSFEPNLHKTFNRGFTSYFLEGRRPDIFSPDTPKAIGEYVGKVKEIRGASFNVAGVATFANGDGLCFINDSNQLEGFRVNRAEGNRLYPLKMPRTLKAGMPLYRNNDQEFERQLSKNSSERRIPVAMFLSETDSGFVLEASVSGFVSVKTKIEAEHQSAQKPPRENIVRQLTKLGGTTYECTDVKMPVNFNWFIPSSVLSTMKRDVVEQLDEAISAKRLVPEVPSEGLRHASGLLRYGKYTYLHNVANAVADDYYSSCGLTGLNPAYELKPADTALLMQCRHCLRYALGACSKHLGNTAKPEWKESLYLVSADGRRFRLEFDCRNCQMNVYNDN